MAVGIIAVVAIAAVGYWWMHRTPPMKGYTQSAQHADAGVTATANTGILAINDNETVIAILEPSWNYYIREKIFLGPNYIGNTTTFGRHGTTLHALALASDYPTYRALAAKGLITLDELSLSDAPRSVFSGGAKIERAAMVALTQAGARLGDVDNKTSTVTFVFGAYRIEKIVSNTAVEANEGSYRLVEGTHVLEVRQEFSDIWAELGWPTYRERRFRVLFKYDTTESKWNVAIASNGRFSAQDRGPRNGNYESANVPPTLDQLRLKRGSEAVAVEAAQETNFTDIEQFFAAFKKAVGTKDIQQIAKCVEFPFEEQGVMTTKDAFIKNYKIGNQEDPLRLVTETSCPTKYDDKLTHGLTYGIENSAFSMLFRKNPDGYWKWCSIYYYDEWER